MNLQPKSVKEILGVASGKLAMTSDTGLLDAKILLKFISGMNDVDLILNSEKNLDDGDIKDYFDLVSRREKGEPIAYIVGTKQFMNLDFKVNSNVLIPRPETEILVERILERLDNLTTRGFEIGLGSACISVSLLKYNENLKMVSTEISEDAIQVAKENIEFYGLEDRIKVYNADLYCEECGGDFDFLVSNPPYIAEREYSELMKDVRSYEPSQALLAGIDGLDFYRKIVKIAPRILKDGALIAFEIGMSQAFEVETMLKNNGFINLKVYKDLAGKDRVIMGEFKNVK